MKLTSWLSWKLNGEKFWIWLSWKLPKRLVYWAAIRLLTYRYGGHPDERKTSEALTTWWKLCQ